MPYAEFRHFAAHVIIITESMKRLLLIFALCLFLPRSVSAQSSSVDDFFRRYDASEGFTSVLLEQKMMQMMSRQAAQRGDKGTCRITEGH